MPPETYLDEKSLLSALAAGDEDALTALVAAHKRRVLTHCLTFTRSFEEAEELTQDIFIKVWKAREKLTEVDSFLDYLFILSRNHLVSYIRKRVKDIDMPDPETLAEELLIPDRQFEVKEIQDLLHAAIDLMPAQRKTVFRLSRIEGLSYEEIAAEMGISKSMVKQHIMAALVQLKTYFRDRGGYGLLLAALFFL